jgi:hypothetical protein
MHALINLFIAVISTILEQMSQEFNSPRSSAEGPGHPLVVPNPLEEIPQLGGVKFVPPVSRGLLPGNR